MLTPTLPQIADLAGIGLTILTALGGIKTAANLMVKLGALLERVDHVVKRVEGLENDVRKVKDWLIRDHGRNS